MSSELVLKEELSKLIAMMISRLPPGKTVTLAVVKQLLLSRYGSTFSSSFLNDHEEFMTKEMAKATAAKASQSGSDEAEDEEEDEEDSDEEDEDDAEEDEESESEESETGSDDEETESEENHSNDGSSGVKRSREEEEELSASSSPASDAAFEKINKDMSFCLRKCGYRVRSRGEDESSDVYQKYLIAEFEKHRMDPSQYDQKAIKRYKVQREVELLQEDGAKLNLDRRQRMGRGLAQVEAPSAPIKPPVIQTAKFLDDE